MKVSELQGKLRASVQALRRTPLPIAEVAPLLNQAADEIERLEQIREAAENLVKVKGRHHSQIAYERLVSALSRP